MSSKIMRGDPTFELPFCRSHKASYQLDLMSLQNRFLVFAGLMSPRDMNDTFWKIKMYRCYQIFLYFSYIPLFMIKVFGCIHYKHDLNILLDAIVAVSLGALGNFGPFALNWEKAWMFMHKMENESAFIRIINQGNSKKISILKDNYHLAKTMCQVILLVANIVGVVWALQVYLLDVLETFTIGEHFNSTANEVLKLYPVVIHIPNVDITDNKIFIILNTLITMLILQTCNKVGVIISYTTSMLLYQSTLFKLVSVSIEEVDNKDSINMESNVQTDQRLKHMKNNKQLLLDSEEEEVKAKGLLVDAIKDHQEALQYLDGVNNLLSAFLFITTFMGAFIFALAMFEVVVNPNFAAKAKHLSSVISVLLVGWILFKSGAIVNDQGQEIYAAACNLCWYEHSIKLQKTLQMVIMRSQKPTTINVGPLLAMTEETYANIVNASYSYFTILLQFESAGGHNGNV